MRTATGTMIDRTSLVLEVVVIVEAAPGRMRMMYHVTMYSHRTHGKHPEERPAAAGQASLGSKVTETELDKMTGPTTAGMDTRIDNGTLKIGHPKKSRGGWPEEGRKFAEVVNSVHMLPIILSLKFLTHRIHPNTKWE